MNTNPYNFLKQRSIYDILIGDTHDMPYLKGKEICDIALKLGFNIPYNQFPLSRWQYMEKLINFCIDNKKCQLLLNYLLSKEHISKLTNSNYESALNNIFDKINQEIYFTGYRISSANGNIKLIHKENIDLFIPTQKISQLSPEYIKKISNQAQQDVQNNNFESAITKSRTLLEEILLYLIEKKGVTTSNNGKILDLYKSVKDLYHLNPHSKANKSINQLLSGFINIITAISEIRNISSDSHGHGQNRIEIDKNTTLLLVNSSITISEFFLSLDQNKNNNINHYSF